MRPWIGIVTVIGAVLLVTASAAAAPPDRWTNSGSYGGSASCGSFTNVFQGSFTESGMTTFDKNGNPVKDIVHVSGSELDWRSGSSDSYTVQFNYTLVYQYATDTTSLNGMVTKATHPGLGVLFHDVGKLVFLPGDVTVIHGPHDVWEQGQDAYCNAFLAIANRK